VVGAYADADARGARLQLLPNVTPTGFMNVRREEWP
jgi:hypothetical protein